MKKTRNGNCFTLNRTFRKRLLTMKLSIFFTFLTIMQVSASVYSQNARFNFNVENKTMREVFKLIEHESNFRFFYNDEFKDLNKNVSFDITGKKIDDIMTLILDNTDVTYRVLENNVIVITPLSNPLNDQQLTVRGTVTDAKTGKPMTGVNVIVEGTTTGVITDASGKYSINAADKKSVLVFSFIGYDPYRQVVGSSSIIDIQLNPSVLQLDEVVVIGYGTQKKSDLTGSVVRINMEEVATTANMNISQALKGHSAGINVDGGAGAGAEPQFSIRGKTSLSASDNPLTILDGIIYNGALSDINVNDVESIDFLKDASAAAVYGSRSSNGVVIITTKKGKSDKPLFNFTMYRGYQDMTNNPVKLMNADQYAIKLVDYYYQSTLYTWYATKPTGPAGKPVRMDITDRNAVALKLRTVEEQNNYLANKEINWLDEVTQTAPIQNYDLSISGKTDRSNFYLSGSYTSEDGIYINDKFNRITLHTNFETKLTDWFTLGLISSYSYRDYSGVPASLQSTITASPLANMYNAAGIYPLNLVDEFFQPHPLGMTYVTNEDIRNNWFNVVTAKINIPKIQGLTYEFNYSNTFYTVKDNTFYPATTVAGAGNKGRAVKKPSERRDWIINNILSYSRTFGTNHRVNATLLYSREQSKGESSTLTASGFDNPALGYNNMGLGTQVTVGSTAWKEDGLSFMARANYIFKDKYMITGTVRRDGYSGFGENKKFATFPSLSLAWVASEETFLNNVKWINFLKLRTSYGENGNQGIGRYSSFSQMGTTSYVFGSTTSVGVYASTLGNSDLGWESTLSFNIGLDYAVLGNRISGSIDLYKSSTTNVLVTRTLPATSGYTSVWTNLGGIENKGIELELKTVNIEGQLRWTSMFVFSLNRDKITKLYGGDEDKDIGNSWFVGKPISSIYDYNRTGGVWTEDELYAGKIIKDFYPGQFRLEDITPDGVIEPNGDRKIIGYKTPNYRFGINNSFSFKNFTLSFFLNSVMGGNGYYLADNSAMVNTDYSTDKVYKTNSVITRQYWTPDNGVDNATGVFNQPKVYSGTYEDRGFVRLQDISLSYDFSKKLLNTLGIVGLQVYVSGKNLYTWTKWSGFDPEVLWVAQEIAPVNEINRLMMRNIIAGIRLSF